MTTTDHRTLSAYEDAEQAHILSHPPVTLYFTVQGLILTGPDRGRDIGDVAQRIVLDHIQTGREVGFKLGTARPWWRLWRETETMTVTVLEAAIEEISFEEFARREGPNWAHVGNAVDYVRGLRGDGGPE